MNNPLWEHLARSRVSAYEVNEALNGPSPFEAGPAWCFDRFGQSTTPLGDGRTVLIAGEHEDCYDPDFHIYNDVVVLHPDGSMDIYGYPQDVFPPTDFHSATLVRDRIILVGSLGYTEKRDSGSTQVLALDLGDFSVSAIETSGSPPGWIHKRRADLSDGGGSIVIRGGKLDRRDRRTLIENIDDWQLRIGEWRWERLTDRGWPRWEVSRSDGKPNHLWEMRQALWTRKLEREEEFEQAAKKLASELGGQPDPEAVTSVYRPDVPHEEMPEREDEYGVYRITVDGVVVRYVEDSYSVQVTVEGSLPGPILDALRTDLLEKLQRLENAECVVESI